MRYTLGHCPPWCCPKAWRAANDELDRVVATLDTDDPRYSHKVQTCEEMAGGYAIQLNGEALASESRSWALAVTFESHEARGYHCGHVAAYYRL
jgi:hypothetical protein